MAETVINPFEMVQIYEQERKVLTLSVRPGERI
jgi:hypothetical protein